jgi:2-keto-3-deoxy-L-fuconate dehydrogenase
MMGKTFADNTALVTGAASGIGLATAQHLAADGARQIILIDLSEEALHKAADSIEADVVILAGDVASPALWAKAAPEIGRLDLAVINAGVSGTGVITDMDFDAWRKILGVNLDGAFLSLQAAMRAMSDGGAIVVTASASGLKAEIGTAAYGASKAGLLQLMRVAAKEGAARGIRVNAIAPGGVESAMWSTTPFFQERVAALGSEAAAYAEIAKAGTPLGRFATAEEIAGQIAFLLSSAAATITGATLSSDGGYLL